MSSGQIYRITDYSSWVHVGAAGTIFPQPGPARPHTMTIPRYDGGPTVDIFPTRIEAYYSAVPGTWKCTAVTISGTRVGGRPGDIHAYTWADDRVDEILEQLGTEAKNFVRRNNPTFSERARQ